MPISGRNAHFSLDNGAETPVHTDISTWIRTIDASPESEDVDGTTLQSPKRVRVPTFQSDTLNITLAWSPTAAAFCRAIKGKTGLNFTYGPDGNAAGKERITGTCNVINAGSIPGSAPDALSELPIELSILTEVAGTFSA